ncbi:MAG: cytidylate kinase-like family protein [Spirochaetales bacterium]|nr:cytidylate kinase-like family protein [Spirochaetales bacterium]
MLSQQIEKLLNEALEDKIAQKTPGPVVTISREYGCPGLKLGRSLSASLQKRVTLIRGSGSWECLDREIIQQAARIVNLPPEMVEKMATADAPGWLASLVNSFQPHYQPSDIEVKRAIGWVIRGLGYIGKFVIVGRGGAVITSDIKNAVHVKLYAPRQWRTASVMAMHNTGKEEALKILNEVDRERIYLRDFFSGEVPEQEHFDIAFNCEKITETEMQSMILQIMEDRKIIAPLS